MFLKAVDPTSWFMTTGRSFVQHIVQCLAPDWLHIEGTIQILCCICKLQLFLLFIYLKYSLNRFCSASCHCVYCLCLNLANRSSGIH